MVSFSYFKEVVTHISIQYLVVCIFYLVDSNLWNANKIPVVYEDRAFFVLLRKYGYKGQITIKFIFISEVEWK